MWTCWRGGREDCPRQGWSWYATRRCGRAGAWQHLLIAQNCHFFTCVLLRLLWKLSMSQKTQKKMYGNWNDILPTLISKFRMSHLKGLWLKRINIHSSFQTVWKSLQTKSVRSSSAGNTWLERVACDVHQLVVAPASFYFLSTANSIFALLSFYFQFAMSHCPCVYVTALLSQVPQPSCFWQ